MSFSGMVKEELSRVEGQESCCGQAELVALFWLLGKFEAENRSVFKVFAENDAVERKCFTLLKKPYNICVARFVQKQTGINRGKHPVIELPYDNETDVFFRCLGLFREADNGWLTLADSAPALQKECCRKAFLRGAFLAAGSISDPRKSYHLEFVCPDPEKATQLQLVIRSFGVDAKTVQRKKSQVVYVKEGAAIVEMLALMGADGALLSLEDIRSLKEMRNSVNRQVNCETANINKTVNAAVKQIEDIRLIEERLGLQSLGEGLAELAGLRLMFPEASLKELGLMLEPAVGKSGVNHRLRKLSMLADSLRDSKEELL